MVLSLEKSIYVLAFLIASLLSTKGISFSTFSVVDNMLWLPINIVKAKRVIDLKNLSLPNVNLVPLFSCLTDWWSSLLKDYQSN